MSGLCPTASELATIKNRAQSLFYPQSYPQQDTCREGLKSRRTLFSGADRYEKHGLGRSSVENNRD
jgi:hypothetical protein